MKIKRKSIGLVVALLSSLNASIPAAMSKPMPRDIPSSTEKVRVPLTPPDSSPDGAQVRVTFQTAPELKFSCNETEVEVTIVGDLLRSNTGGLAVDRTNPTGYKILGNYKHKGLLTDSTNTCLYNFNLNPKFVGKKALVNVSSPGLQSGSSVSFSGGLTDPVTIRNLRQTFKVQALPRYFPN